MIMQTCRRVICSHSKSQTQRAIRRVGIHAISASRAKPESPRNGIHVFGPAAADLGYDPDNLLNRAIAAGSWLTL